MGGVGSGRSDGWGWKPTKSSLHRLEIKALQAKQLLQIDKRVTGTWQWNNGSSIQFEVDTAGAEYRFWVKYRLRGEDLNYIIRLVTTTPNYGGLRWWFMCPNLSCWRKVSYLCLRHHFMCRSCANMAYDTQNEAPRHRLNHQIFRRYAQLNHEPGDGFIYRPKGMHQRTFDRQCDALEALEMHNNYLWAKHFSSFAKLIKVKNSA